VDFKVIHVYTRAQAIEDGELVDLDAGELAGLAAEAGILVPVAMTAGAFARYVALTPAAERALNDVKGRAWDVLWMCWLAMRCSRGRSTLVYEFYASVDAVEPERCRLKAVLGPDDDGRPCLTLMEVWED
jgi:hypothetical protein